MVINLTRVFVLVIPLTLIGSNFYGYTGLIFGLVAGKLLSGTHAISSPAGSSE